MAVNNRLLAAFVPIGFSFALLVSPWAQAQSPEEPFDYARSSAFSYHPNGQLKSETVEPGHPNLCVVTTHGYDDWGNKSSTSSANCAGASGDALFEARTATQSWSRETMPTFQVGTRTLVLQRGQFVLDTVNAVGHAGQQLYDPRFGLLTEAKDANGLASRSTYDELGRKEMQRNPDDTGVLYRYCTLPSSGLDTSSNSSGCGAPAYAPADAVQYVQSWPVGTSGAKSGPWSIVFTDRAGREIRSATEGFDGLEQPAELRGGVIVRDTVYGATGVKVMETQPYWVATGSSINTASNNVGVTKVVVDALGRPKTIYRADADAVDPNLVEFGSGSFNGYGQYGKRKAALTRLAYTSGSTTTTNDLGHSRTEEKNPIGEVFRITDAYGAQVVLQTTPSAT